MNPAWIKNRLTYMRSKFFLSGTNHLIVNNIDNISEIIQVLDGILADLQTEVVDIDGEDVVE